MIAPHPRLIALTAILVLPACAAASLLPALFWPCVLFNLLLAAIAALDAFMGLRRLTKVTATGPASLKWFKDRTATLTVQLTNLPAKLGAARASIELPPGLQASALAVDVVGDTAKFPCLPIARGRYQLTRCYLGTLSPARLWRIRKDLDIRTDIRVFPDLEREPGAKMLLLGKTGGLRAQRAIGRGREFERLRDYAPGDSFDEIAWKATARRGKPVVRVFQVERTQDVYAVIDSSRLGARNGAVEQFVSAALMLALATANYGDNFGLVTFSDTVNHFVPAARGMAHFSRCRDAIFDLKPSTVSPDFAELFSFLQLRIRRRSLLLFLTDLADPLLAETFLRDVHLLARRHLVLVNRLNDGEMRPLFSGKLPANAAEVNLRLAGHLEWAALRDLERNLHRLGVGMSVLTPGTVGLDLVRQYSNVKRRQAL